MTVVLDLGIGSMLDMMVVVVVVFIFVVFENFLVLTEGMIELVFVVMTMAGLIVRRSEVAIVVEQSVVVVVWVVVNDLALVMTIVVTVFVTVVVISTSRVRGRLIDSAGVIGKKCPLTLRNAVMITDLKRLDNPWRGRPLD